jgi:hypothetical protein
MRHYFLKMILLLFTSIATLDGYACEFSLIQEEEFEQVCALNMQVQSCNSIQFERKTWYLDVLAFFNGIIRKKMTFSVVNHNGTEFTQECDMTFLPNVAAMVLRNCSQASHETYRWDFSETASCQQLNQNPQEVHDQQRSAGKNTSETHDQSSPRGHTQQQ